MPINTEPHEITDAPIRQRWSVDVPLIDKGRFKVIAGPDDGRQISTAQVKAVIDQEGIP